MAWIVAFATGCWTKIANTLRDFDRQLAGCVIDEAEFSTGRLERGLKDQLHHHVEVRRLELEPVQRDLLKLMSRFLQKFPDEGQDLAIGIEYLDSFLGLRQRIVDEDLPRHEQRFRERLNEKVIHEIGLFRAELESERRQIEDRIEMLNASLKQLEYRPGTHIQLEPRPVRDREVIEFQTRLRECIESSFDDSAAANEARFERIRELVEKLRDENNRRWRDKVTDVRRWFDFVAAVINRETLETISVYQDSSGQSGGEKAKLAFTILVAAIAYQYDLDPEHPTPDRFQFVVVDEMFSRVDDQHAEYAMELFPSVRSATSDRRPSGCESPRHAALRRLLPARQQTRQPLRDFRNDGHRVRGRDGRIGPRNLTNGTAAKVARSVLRSGTFGRRWLLRRHQFNVKNEHRVGADARGTFFTVCQFARNKQAVLCATFISCSASVQPLITCVTPNSAGVSLSVGSSPS